MNLSELTVRIRPYSHDTLTGCSWWKRECFDQARWKLIKSDDALSVEFRACDRHAPRMLAEWIGREVNCR